jgi:hypothetical protein
MDRTYNDVKDKFHGYWPKAKFSPMEKTLWDQRLRNLNMNYLWEALDDVKCAHYGSTPQLNWVLKAYAEVSARIRPGKLEHIGPTPEEIEEFKKDQEAIAFQERVDKDLSTVSDDEKRRAAESLPVTVASNIASWGKVTKGLVWLKLFGGSPSSASQSHSLVHVPPV